jgi:hypothetical protein
MELKRTTELVADLTRRLGRALDTYDPDDWEHLIQRREKALKDFRLAHAQASAAERERHQAEIRALVAEDRRLQERSRDMLAAVAGEFKQQWRRSHQNNNVAGGNTCEACLDRKA